MGTPYVGEIRMFAGNFAPSGWEFCNGQLMSIAENEVLYILIGTTYGGDGQTTFALPDLRGRIPIHQNDFHVLSEASGTETVTLTSATIPQHNHTFAGSTDTATTRIPGANVAAATIRSVYAPPGTITPMKSSALGMSGGGLPHDNMQPSLCISFIISLYGVYPTTN